jgi:hypothetical protein
MSRSRSRDGPHSGRRRDARLLGYSPLPARRQRRSAGGAGEPHPPMAGLAPRVAARYRRRRVGASDGPGAGRPGPARSPAPRPVFSCRGAGDATSSTAGRRAAAARAASAASCRPARREVAGDVEERLPAHIRRVESGSKPLVEAQLDHAPEPVAPTSRSIGRTVCHRPASCLRPGGPDRSDKPGPSERPRLWAASPSGRGTSAGTPCQRRHAG